MNFFYSFKTENKLTSHEKVCKSKDSCETVMQTEKNIVTVNKTRILKKFAKDKYYQKVRDNCHYTGKYRGAVHSDFNLKFNVPNEIPVVFNNDHDHHFQNYDHHFIMKKLANEFEEEFERLRKKEKCKTFSVPIKKEITNYMVANLLKIYLKK